MGGVQSNIGSIITLPTFSDNHPTFDSKTDTDQIFPNLDTLLDQEKFDSGNCSNI